MSYVVNFLLFFVVYEGMTLAFSQGILLIRELKKELNKNNYFDIINIR